jgi:hypothetical protein
MAIRSLTAAGTAIARGAMGLVQTSERAAASTISSIGFGGDDFTALDDTDGSFNGIPSESVASVPELSMVTVFGSSLVGLLGFSFYQQRVRFGSALLRSRASKPRRIADNLAQERFHG